MGQLFAAILLLGLKANNAVAHLRAVTLSVGETCRKIAVMSYCSKYAQIVITEGLLNKYGAIYNNPNPMWQPIPKLCAHF